MVNRRLSKIISRMPLRSDCSFLLTLPQTMDICGHIQDTANIQMQKAALIISLSLLLMLACGKQRSRPKPASQRPQSKQSLLSRCSAFECDTIWSYSHAVLTLSWPGSFCRQAGKCLPRWFNSWDGYSFGVHGYWPTYEDQDLACVNSPDKKYSKCPDPRCNYDYYFTTSLEESPIADLREDMDRHWPEFGIGNRGEFRQNQWNKHGVCYLKRIMEDFPDRYTQEQIFRYYFESTLVKAKMYSQVRKFEYRLKEDLAKDLGIMDAETFYVSCKFNSGKCFIGEIRLCYNIANPGEERLTRCFQKDLDTESYRREGMPLALENPKGLKELSDENL